MNMITYDWYDGPIGGILIDPRCGRSFKFYLLDWDSEHRVRLFALQEVSPAVVDSLFRLTSESPSWPVWYPKMLIHPTREASEWVGSVKQHCIRPYRVDSILVWDSSNDLALGSRELTEEEQAEMMPWFEAVELRGRAIDWFKRGMGTAQEKGT